MKPTVLLIEDDNDMRLSLAQSLELEDITVIQASGLSQAKRAIRANFAGVILSDIRMPKHDGFDVLTHVKSVDAELPVILLTGEADVPMALRALKDGAYDFLEKPCPSDKLLEALNRAIAHRTLVTKTRLMDQRLKRLDPAAQNFPGESAAIQTFRDELRRLANEQEDVHFYGEDGVGKKVAAYTLHAISMDRRKMVSINLQSKSTSLTADIPNSPELDLTIKNIDLASATQLDELLELKTHRPKLRLITTSTMDWQNCCRALSYNIEDMPLRPSELYIPNLVERRTDLPVIFQSLARAHARNLNIDLPEIPIDILDRVAAKNWHGNINELRDYAHQTLLELSARKEQRPALTLAERMDVYEAQILSETLEHFGGNVSSTSENLGLPQKTLYDRLARHGLKPKDFK